MAERNMKKILLTTALLTLLTFIAGCTEDNEEVTKGNNDVDLNETDNNEEVTKGNNNVEDLNETNNDKQLTATDKIRIEMEKDTTTVGKIVLGRLDIRKLGFLRVLDEYGYDTVTYSLPDELQGELLEFIKSIPLKKERSGHHHESYTSDFIIYKPTSLVIYEADAHVAVYLDRKELAITGGDLLRPNVYKVLENEEEVFEKLESYFKLSTEEIDSSK